MTLTIAQYDDWATKAGQTQLWQTTTCQGCSHKWPYCRRHGVRGTYDNLGRLVAMTRCPAENWAQDKALAEADALIAKWDAEEA